MKHPCNFTQTMLNNLQTAFDFDKMIDRYDEKFTEVRMKAILWFIDINSLSDDDRVVWIHCPSYNNFIESLGYYADPFIDDSTAKEDEALAQYKGKRVRTNFGTVYGIEFESEKHLMVFKLKYS